MNGKIQRLPVLSINDGCGVVGRGSCSWYIATNVGILVENVALQFVFAYIIANRIRRSVEGAGWPI